MKKTFVVIWSVVLTIVAIYLVFLGTNRFKLWRIDQEYQKQKEIIAPLKNDSFRVSKLDSLLIEQPYVMLGIGLSDCSACDFVLLSNIPDQFPLSRYYIDKQKHISNNLVAQVFYSRATPDVYILNKDKDVIGRLKSNIDLHEMLDGIINKQSYFCEAEIGGVSQENVLDMLNFSFKSLLAYLSEDIEGIYNNAHTSRKKGEYFFNNYMLYKYHESTGHQDSVRIYKERALQYINHGIDVIMYRSLIEEIDPDNEKLRWVPA